jgi:hypothetical protein
MLGVVSNKTPTRDADYRVVVSSLSKTGETATLEVNGLSDLSVKIEPVRRNHKAPITAVTVTWWRKRGEEYRRTLRELRQPKVGRQARLKGLPYHL